MHVRVSCRCTDTSLLHTYGQAYVYQNHTHAALPMQSVARTVSCPAETGLRESHGMLGL